MIKKVFLFLLFSNVCSSSSSKYVEPIAKNNCDVCELRYSNTFESTGVISQKFQNFQTLDYLPCRKCKIDGFGNLGLTPGTKTCHRIEGNREETEFHVTFPKITLDCNCELVCDPNRNPAITRFEEMAEKECMSAEDFKSRIKPKLLKKNLSSKSMKKLQACIPGGKSKSERKACPNGRVTGKFLAKWESLKIGFTTVITKPDETGRIEAITIENEDTEGLTVQCEGNHPQYDKTCKCLMSSDFNMELSLIVFETLLYCYVNDQTKNFQQIFHYLSCEEDDY